MPRRLEFPPVYVTVDVVVLTIRDDRLQVLMIKRGVPPWRGRWALPGGFIQGDEDLITAARRELREETGIRVEPRHLEQVATFGSPGRDPRARTVSVCYLAVLPGLGGPTYGTDAEGAGWLPVDDVLERRLPFDHREILEAAVERTRSKLEYTPLATAFVDEPFTIGELRRVYEIIWGRRLDAGNFQRKVQNSAGFVRTAGGARAGGPGRPARLFTAGTTRTLNLPILR